MKKYFNTGISLLFFSLVSFVVQAQSPVARITQVSGDVFVSDGKVMRKVQPGQHLFDLSEITTAVGASVAFNDFHDHVYHLAGQGQVKLMNRTIELRRGYFWIQSLGQGNQGFQVVTANARLGVTTGQGVISFSPATSRTQFMSLEGNFRFSSLLQPDLDVMVRPGQFSFVDREYSQGAPRHSTNIGKGTFAQVLALFPTMKVNRPGVDTEFVVEAPASSSSSSREQAGPSRLPASVAASPSGKVNKAEPGMTIFVPLERNGELRQKREDLIRSIAGSSPKERSTRASSAGRSPASVESTARPGNVPLRIFGQQHKTSPTPKESSRVERIVQKGERAPASLTPSSSRHDVFEQALEREYRLQQPHSDDVNALIRDLRNFQMDYQEGF